jgi:hypothetical protein
VSVSNKVFGNAPHSPTLDAVFNVDWSTLGNVAGALATAELVLELEAVLPVIMLATATPLEFLAVASLGNGARLRLPKVDCVRM